MKNEHTTYHKQNNIYKRHSGTICKVNTHKNIAILETVKTCVNKFYWITITSPHQDFKLL